MYLVKDQLKIDSAMPEDELNYPQLQYICLKEWAGTSINRYFILQLLTIIIIETETAYNDSEFSLLDILKLL